MGLSVNGTVITSTQSFPITGSFETYHSFLQVHPNAGVNLSPFAVSDHGLSCRRRMSRQQPRPSPVD